MGRGRRIEETYSDNYKVFFLKFSLGWIFLFALVVITKVYESFGDLAYMALGLTVSLPAVVYPLLFPGKADSNIPILQRYWVKANLWIAIFSYVGNYFWTHYFYKILRAYYTFPVQIQLNAVPLFLYFITHAYYVSYHTSTTIVLFFLFILSHKKLLRRFRGSTAHLSWLARILGTCLLVFVMAYITAFMEAFTVASVPYYVIENRAQMYLIGSAFYGIYFYVSFPMFYRLDEDPRKSWSLGRVAIDALAASMLVTIILDLWRIALGPLSSLKLENTLPWLIASQTP